MLAFFDLRRGVPADALTEIHNRHGQALLRDYDQQPNALIQRRGALFVIDRAFIDAAFLGGTGHSPRPERLTALALVRESTSFEASESPGWSDAQSGARVADTDAGAAPPAREDLYSPLWPAQRSPTVELPWRRRPKRR